VALLATAPRAGLNGTTMSCHMLVEFVPPLDAGAVSNPKSSLAAMSAKRDRRIAIRSQGKAPSVLDDGSRAVPEADNVKRSPATHRFQPRVAACGG
jgi:hypothetical protein